MAHDIAGASRARPDVLRRIAVIANPVAKSGAGARIAERVAAVLASDFGASSQPHVGDLALDVLLTERPRHAQELAASLPTEISAHSARIARRRGVALRIVNQRARTDQRWT